MDKSDLTIFEQIAKKVVADLESDDLFTDDLVQQIARLFESGDIADQAQVLKTLEGVPIEDSQPRN